MSPIGTKVSARAAGPRDGARDLYGSLRPVVSLTTVIVQMSPIVWLIAHVWSLPPDAFWRAWFLEPEILLPYWLATSLVIWASFVTLLVLAWLPRTRVLILKDAAAYPVFGRRVAEAAVIWTVLTILAFFLWYGVTVREGTG